MNCFIAWVRSQVMTQVCTRALYAVGTVMSLLNGVYLPNYSYHLNHVCPCTIESLLAFCWIGTGRREKWNGFWFGVGFIKSIISEDIWRWKLSCIVNMHQDNFYEQALDFEECSDPENDSLRTRLPLRPLGCEQWWNEYAHSEALPPWRTSSEHRERRPWRWTFSR